MILPLPSEDPSTESEEEAEEGRRRVGIGPEELPDRVDEAGEVHARKKVDEDEGVGMLRQVWDGLYT